MEFAIASFIGFILTCWGIILFIKTLVFVNNSVVTDGKIVNPILYKRGSYERREDYYHPIIEFTTQSGEAVSFQSAVVEDSSTYSIGDKLRTRYSKSDPENARINEHLAIWWRVYSALFFGILMLGAGIAFEYVIPHLIYG